MMSFFIAFLFCFALTPIVIRFARYFGLVDDPKKRPHPATTHSGVVPRAGGIGIYLSLLITAVFFVEFTPMIIALFIAAGIAVAVGVWDDYRDMSPYLRFGTNILVAVVILFAGVHIPFITNPLGGVLHFDTWCSFGIGGFVVPFCLVSAGVTVMWIVWMMNAVGWSAGVDGQLPGFVMIAGIVIALLAQRFVEADSSQSTVITISLITAGVYAGFLPWNLYPQKIMPGYSGKSLAGFMLAVLAIMSSTKVGAALLVLGVPMIDAGYTVIRRIMTGVSPFRADRGHLHHLLLDMGWGRRRIAFFYWAVTALLGFVALQLDSQGKVFAFLVMGIVVGGLIVAIQLFNFFRILARNPS